MTSNQLAVREQQSHLPTVAEWNATVAQAEALAQTDIVPKPFRGQPHAIIAVAMIGREMGLSPMLSMQYINVIDGKPSVSPELMNARIRKAGHAIRVDHWDHQACTLTGIRGDTGESMSVTFTMEDAARAGLVKAGGNWDKWPRAMVWARALSMLARALFPDAILGARYTPEELGAEVDEDGVAVQSEAPTQALPPDLAQHVAQTPVAQQGPPRQVAEEPTEVEVLGEEPGYTMTPEDHRAVVNGEGIDYQAPPADPTRTVVTDGTPQAEAVVAQAFAQPGQPATTSTGTAGGFVQPTPPPPPTPEQVHAKQARELFPKGWPMGNQKGGDPTDPDAVDDGSLHYFIANADVNHPQYGRKNANQQAWCQAELRRRAAMFTEPGRPKGGAAPGTGQELDDAYQQAMDTDHAGELPADTTGLPAPAPITDNTPLDMLPDDRPITVRAAQQFAAVMVRNGYAENMDHAAQLIVDPEKAKGGWTAGRVRRNIAHMQANPGPRAATNGG